MENEHFSVSQITNCHIIIIVNSPERSLIKFYRGRLSPGFNSLRFTPVIFAEKVLLSYTIPSISNGWGFELLVGGILSRGGTQQIFTGKLCPEVQVVTFPHTMFDRKGTPFVYHSIPFGGWGVEWLVTGILKWAQTIQGPMGRKTALSKSNLRAILQFLFLVTKSY